MPVVTERTNVVYVTNAATGAVSGYMAREPVATNLVAAVVTNFVPVFYTNVVQVPVTNLVAKPEALATIEATGSIVNTFAPGIGSILALALGGLYHGYRQVRNRRVNEALIQGVETARAVLTTTPQGQAADAQFVKWLMDHQKEAGVFTTVSGPGGAAHRQPGGEDDGAGDCGAGPAGAAAAEQPRTGVRKWRKLLTFPDRKCSFTFVVTTTTRFCEVRKWCRDSYLRVRSRAFGCSKWLRAPPLPPLFS